MKNFLSGLSRGQQSELVNILKSSQVRNIATAIEAHLQGDSTQYDKIGKSDEATEEEIEAVFQNFRF